MRPTDYIRKVLAAILMVWLSGLVFVFSCQATMASDTGGSCPLARAGKMSPHCHKGARSGPEQNTVTRTAPFTADCCAFLPVVFDKARKVEPVQKLSFSQVVHRPIAIPPVLRKPLRGWQTGGYRVRVADAQTTFIKNRVLRI